MALSEGLEPPMSSPDSFNPLDAIRLLRSAGGSLLAQAAQHGKLARIEWEIEKRRLLQMHLATLLGLACLMCAMLSAGVLVLALAWETAYRIPAVTALIALYGLGTGLAWRRFETLSARSHESFSVLREELAADVALLRSHL